MKQHEVTVPQIGLIAGTRAMLGAASRCCFLKS